MTPEQETEVAELISRTADAVYKLTQLVQRQQEQLNTLSKAVQQLQNGYLGLK